MSPVILMLVLLPWYDEPRSPALRDDQKFEGNWVLESHHYGKAISNLRIERRMTVENGVWNEWWDDKYVELKVRREAAEPWAILEREQVFGPPKSHGGGIGGSLVTFFHRGIYCLEGNTLTFAYGDRNLPLPEDFELKEKRNVEVWRRVPTP